MQIVLDQAMQKGTLRVVPVLLPGAKMLRRGRLPHFISRLAWVDFRQGLDDPETLEHLVNQIRGFKPKHFSFNVDGGRCDSCKGEGEQVKVTRNNNL